jgi:hypothetical protein
MAKKKTAAKVARRRRRRKSEQAPSDPPYKSQQLSDRDGEFGRERHPEIDEIVSELDEAERAVAEGKKEIEELRERVSAKLEDLGVTGRYLAAVGSGYYWVALDHKTRLTKQRAKDSEVERDATA